MSKWRIAFLVVPCGLFAACVGGTVEISADGGSDAAATVDAASDVTQVVDSSPDTQPVSLFCLTKPGAILCDDFEDTTWDPWTDPPFAQQAIVNRVRSPDGALRGQSLHVARGPQSPGPVVAYVEKSGIPVRSLSYEFDIYPNPFQGAPEILEIAYSTSFNLFLIHQNGSFVLSEEPTDGNSFMTTNFSLKLAFGQWNHLELIVRMPQDPNTGSTVVLMVNGKIDTKSLSKDSAKRFTLANATETVRLGLPFGPEGVPWDAYYDNVAITPK